MEILKMIDLLEDKVEQSNSIPLLNRALIDKEEILAAIEEIRLNIPEDMKQARLIKEERKRIIAEAQTEADEIINNAKRPLIGLTGIKPQQTNPGRSDRTFTSQRHREI